MAGPWTIPRQIVDLLADLAAFVSLDTLRASAAATARPQASPLVPHLPLVHRTGRAGSLRWKDIFVRECLVAGEVCTDYEKQLGLSHAVYFFLGYPAYPHGNIVFLFKQIPQVVRDGLFTPFDSGALENHLKPLNPITPWSDSERCDFLARHMGQGPDLINFTVDYLSTHFQAPVEYLQRGQYSDPEFLIYHQCRSDNGDRRGWTIEARSPVDVPISAHDDILNCIILRYRSLLLELPPAYQRLAIVLEEDDDDDFAAAVASHIVGSITPRVPSVEDTP